MEPAGKNKSYFGDTVLFRLTQEGLFAVLFSEIKDCSEFEAENEFKMNQQSVVLNAVGVSKNVTEATTEATTITDASTTEPAIVSKPTNNETGNLSLEA